MEAVKIRIRPTEKERVQRLADYLGCEIEIKDDDEGTWVYGTVNWLDRIQDINEAFREMNGE